MRAVPKDPGWLRSDYGAITGTPKKESPRGEATPAFRVDINGLRAVAILFVLLFHFSVPGFSGGYIGVDIFFVISGYLIARILHSDRHRSFSMLGFYRLRALRIYPAMLTLLAVLLLAGFFFVEPVEYARLARSSLYSIFGVVNFVFQSEADYFAPVRDTNWLLHMWTLSVELQFYLICPPVLLWASRRGAECEKRLLVGTCVASALLSSGLSFFYPSVSFFSTPCRIWEFMAGALAFAFRDSQLGRARTILSGAGLTLIICSLPLAASGAVRPAFAIFLPVLGTAAILLSPSRSRLLSNPVSQLVGSLSYSLYLWHWPVLVAMKYYGVPLTAASIGLMFVAAFILAGLSRVLIEKPLLASSPGGIPQRARFPLLFTVFFAVFTAAVFIVTSNGYSSRIPASISFVSKAQFGTEHIRQDRCFLSPPAGGEKFAAECFNPVSPSEGHEIMLFGDSHAAHLWPGIASTDSFQSYRLLQATSGACPPFFLPGPPLPGALSTPPDVFDGITGVVVNCPTINQRALRELRKRPPRIVMLSARWSFYNEHSLNVVKELERLIGEVAALGSKVILVGPIPEWSPKLPQKVFRPAFQNGGRVPKRMEDETFGKISELDRDMAALSARMGIGYVSLVHLLCENNQCRTTVPDGESDALIAWDSAHLTLPGSKWIAEHGLAREISNQLR